MKLDEIGEESEMPYGDRSGDRRVAPEGAEIVLQGGVRLLLGTRARFLGYQTFGRQGDPLALYRAWGDGETPAEVTERIGVYLDALAAGKVSWPAPFNRRQPKRRKR